MSDAIVEDMPSEAANLLDTLVPGIVEAIGDLVVGIYLWGSLTLGGYVPGKSDVDLLVCLHRDPDEREAAALTPLHGQIVTRWPQWHNRVEVAYVGVPSLQSFRHREHQILRTSPGEPLNLRMADHRWLIDWFQVSETGIAMVRPQPTEVLPSITADELRAEAHNQLLVWVEHDLRDASPGMLAYRVLAVARARHAIERSQQTSKQGAAQWAASSRPHWAPLLEQATSLHEGEVLEEGAPHLTPVAVRQFIAEMAEANFEDRS